MSGSNADDLGRAIEHAHLPADAARQNELVVTPRTFAVAASFVGPQRAAGRRLRSLGGVRLRALGTESLIQATAEARVALGRTPSAFLVPAVS